MNVIDLVMESGINPGRAIGSKREHHCSCPGCGGSKRFRIWPEQNNGHGSYNCRDCDAHGDNVQYCQDFLGMDFHEAVEKCDRDDLCRDPSRSGNSYRKPKPLQTPGPKKLSGDFTPNSHDMPGEEWISKANEFATWCNLELLKHKKALVWLAKRGISEDAVRRYCLGWNPGNDGKPLYKSRKSWGLPVVLKNNKPKPLWIPVGLVIPYMIDNQVVRLRIRRPQPEREKNLPDLKYYVVPGSFMGTMVLEPKRKAHIVVEAELDAIACASAGRHAGGVSVMTVEGKPDAYAHSILKDSLQILNALDYENTGGGQKAGTRANKWWEENYPDNCRRWPVPEGKDPGEAAERGVDLGLWIKAGLPPVFTIERSPLTQPSIPESPGQSAAFPPGPEEVPAAQKVEEDLPEEVVELRDLLAANSLLLLKRDKGRTLGVKRVTGSSGGMWPRRISDLVFGDPVVGGYLDRFPDGIIGPKSLGK